MRPDYPIKTDRLVLRPFEPGDVDDVFVYRSLPEVNRYLYCEPCTREEAAVGLAKWAGQDEISDEGQTLALAVTLEGHVIGEVDLKWLSGQHRQGEIGYIFNPAHHGNGYAREAAGTMLRIGFEELDLHRIIADCDARNERSWRVMERLGMRREAHFRHSEIVKGEWGDRFVYAMLAEEYRQLK